MYNQPVETFVGLDSALVDDGAQLVYWVFVEVKSLGTKGELHIHDGVSTQGKVAARINAGYSRVSSFFPPIRCSVGLYIHIVSGVTSYTVGFLSGKTALKQQFPIGS